MQIYLYANLCILLGNVRMCVCVCVPTVLCHGIFCRELYSDRSVLGNKQTRRHTHTSQTTNYSHPEWFRTHLSGAVIPFTQTQTRTIKEGANNKKLENILAMQYNIIEYYTTIIIDIPANNKQNKIKTDCDGINNRIVIAEGCSVVCTEGTLPGIFSLIWVLSQTSRQVFNKYSPDNNNNNYDDDNREHGHRMRRVCVCCQSE